MIPFKRPGIGAVNQETSNNFSTLETASKMCSSAVGWAVKLWTSFDKSEVTSTILPEVVKRLQGCSERLCTGYACLLYFANKV